MAFRRSILLSTVIFSSFVAHNPAFAEDYYFEHRTINIGSSGDNILPYLEKRIEDPTTNFDLNGDNILSDSEKRTGLMQILAKLEGEGSLVLEMPDVYKKQLDEALDFLDSNTLETKHTRQLEGYYDYYGYVLKKKDGSYVPISFQQMTRIRSFKKNKMQDFLNIYGQYKDGIVGDPETGQKLDVNALAQQRRDLESRLRALLTSGASDLTKKDFEMFQNQMKFISDVFQETYKKTALYFPTTYFNTFTSGAETIQDLVGAVNSAEPIKAVSQSEAAVPPSINSLTAPPPPLYSQLEYHSVVVPNIEHTGTIQSTLVEHITLAPVPGVDPSTTPNSPTFGNSGTSGSNGADCDALCESMKL